MCGDLTAARHSLSRAVEFLLQTSTPRIETSRSAHFEREGSWTDFNAFGVESDEWVTAYTAYSLAVTGQSSACDEACRAWEWLVSCWRSHGSGFGYTATSARDADSSSWACRLASIISRSSHPCARESLDLVKRCARPDGGYATFCARDLEHHHSDRMEGVAGWTTSHVCVTATAAAIPEIAADLDVFCFLQRAQAPQGSWISYWWEEPEYATAHAIESLALPRTCHSTIQLAVNWLTGSPLPRSSFALALRVLGLSSAGSNGFLPALRALLERQLADGSWPPSTRLRIPPPSLADPSIIWNWNEESNGFGCVITDQRRVFTTATAVRALASCLKQ